jgi:hypothetical protein
MIWALKDRPAQDFQRPAGLVEVEICALSGRLPNRHCPHRRSELFIAGTEPTEACDIHRLFRIDIATGLQATGETPPERVRERVYAVYPPEAQAWAVGQGIPQPPPVPEGRAGLDGTEAAAGAALLEIVSPFQLDRYRISSALPLEDQRILIKARPASRAFFARVTLFVDDEPLASFVRPPYRTWWPLQPGDHRIYAVGETPDGAQVVSKTILIAVSG